MRIEVAFECLSKELNSLNPLPPTPTPASLALGVDIPKN